MVTITGTKDGVTHEFTSDNEFLSLGEWILVNKGKEVFDAWELRNAANEEGAEQFDLYSEWIQDQGITHTRSDF
jgi:hypothetical protein